MWATAFSLACAAPSWAADTKVTLGVFLPTTLADGQERFKFAEAMAAKLSGGGKAVVPRSFGRYEDFSKAVSDGLLDLAVVESWAAAELGAKVLPVATAPLSGEAMPRWALVAPQRATVKALAGKRVAVARGVPALDKKFASHVLFAGDLDAQRHFRWVSAPNVESALKLVEVRGAEAALVPLQHVPQGMQVLYRSPRVPGAALISLRDAGGAWVEAAKAAGAVPPFDALVPAEAGSLEEFRRLVQKGPPRRQPMVTESAPLKVDVSALIKMGEVGPVYPSFVGAVDAPADQPDD
ncbi:MAG TPA: hypothetical protein VEY30_01930 [Myxococcaceae bacterium]|nr:hypothetical protein [Myxococcaceae bacterium]